MSYWKDVCVGETYWHLGAKVTRHILALDSHLDWDAINDEGFGLIGSEMFFVYVGCA